MKIVFYIIGYVLLVIPSLFIALNKWMEIADPSTLEIAQSFWLSSIGKCFWFGLAFILPFFVLIGFNFLTKRIFKKSVSV